MKRIEAEKVKLFIFMLSLIIWETDGISSWTQPKGTSGRNGDTSANKRNSKFALVNTPSALLEQLFKEKFGSFQANKGNEINSWNTYRTQIFVTNIDGISAGSFTHADGDNVFVDYMDNNDSSGQDNFTVPIIFVIMQGSQNCSVTNISMHQKGANGNWQWESSVSSSSFGQQSQSQSQNFGSSGVNSDKKEGFQGISGNNGFQQQQGNSKVESSDSTTPSPTMKFNTFATMKPFIKFQK